MGESVKGMVCTESEEGNIVGCFSGDCVGNSAWLLREWGVLIVSDDTRFRSIERGSCGASHDESCLTSEPSSPVDTNGGSSSGPNTEEGRDGSNGAADEMDTSDRSESELCGTVNP